MVPHFLIVPLVSLITPKRIEPITWDWSHFEDILEENMVYLQNEGLGPLRDLTGAPKGPNMAKIDQNLEFLRFCYRPISHR